MSAEGAVSVGTPGGGVAVTATGPVVAGAGSSISAEVGTSGVGFDGGSPTFSGLGRMDAFGTPSMGVPEGPVKGNIFDNTSVFQPTIPVNEGPPPFPLEGTFVIAKAGEPSADQILGQPEINVESALESYLETSDVESTEITAETITQAVEDLKTNDPLVYAQLKSDLESVDVILDLVDQVGTDVQTSASISNSAIETAVQRSGLIETVEEKADAEVETETEASSQADTAFVDTSVETRNAADDTNRPDDAGKKSGEDYIWDEGANAAREEDATLAIDVTFETGVDPETGKVKGGDVVAAMNSTPSDKEKSKLAKEEGIDGDGSYDGLTDILEHKVFDSEEEARTAAKDAILSNPGVERGKGKTKASDEQQIKVLRGGKPREKQLKMAS